MPPQRSRSKKSRLSAKAKREAAKQDTQSKPSSIPQLPNEILNKIISYLPGDRATLSACCLVSTRFYNVCSKLLCRQLSLDPRKVVDIGAFLDRRDGWGTKWKLGAARTSGLREYVEILSVKSHGPSWCNGFTNHGILFPNVRTLEIIFTPHGKAQIDDIFGASGPLCQAANSVRPKTLVIRNSVFRVDHIHALIHGCRARRWDSLEEIIFVSSQCEVASFYGDWRRLEVARVIQNLKRITFISDPSPGQGRAFGSYLYYLGGPVFQSLPIAYPNLHLWIVAHRSINPRATSQQARNYVREYVLSGLDRADIHVLTPDKIRKMKENMSFFTFEEYMAGGSWKGQFEPEEMQRWLTLTEDVGNTGSCERVKQVKQVKQRTRQLSQRKS